MHRAMEEDSLMTRYDDDRFKNKEQLNAHSGILPFKILVKHRIGLLMHKLSNGNIPTPLLNIYESNKGHFN